MSDIELGYPDILIIIGFIFGIITGGYCVRSDLLNKAKEAGLGYYIINENDNKVWEWRD